MKVRVGTDARATLLTRLRPGFGYFVCISAINTVNGVLNFQADGALGVVAVALSLVLPSVLVSAHVPLPPV